MKNLIRLLNFGLLFPIMTSKMPQEFAFAILRVICFTSVIFVPETKKAIR